MFNIEPDFKNNNLLKSHENDMGYDIRSPGEVFLSPGTHKIIDSKLCVFMPGLLGAFIKSRSGLAMKHNIEVSNAGVIDSGFCESCKIKIYNRGLNEPFRIKKGDRIAQMVFLIRPEAFFENNIALKQPLEKFSIKEVSKEAFDKLNINRSGIGSTGIK